MIKLKKASDGTHHPFPHDAPDDEIEKYLWRYENGQDLPDFALEDRYHAARAHCARMLGVESDEHDLEREDCACDDERPRKKRIVKICRVVEA